MSAPGADRARRAAARSVDAEGVSIRGNATADDVAAVLATLRELAARGTAGTGYDRWRRQRIHALRTCPPA